LNDTGIACKTFPLSFNPYLVSIAGLENAFGADHEAGTAIIALCGILLNLTGAEDCG